MRGIKTKTRSGERKLVSLKNNGSAHKLQMAARIATLGARRENKAFGVDTLVARADGLYLCSISGKAKRIKKGDYRPIKLGRRLIDIGK